MERLTTTVLLHETPVGRHHDWLIDPPRGTGWPEDRVWCARIGPAPARWGEAGRLLLGALPPHRRVYLGYEGPVSGGRGWVRGADRGWCVARRWTADRLILDVALRGYAGRVALRRLAPTRWAAVFDARQAPL